MLLIIKGLVPLDALYAHSTEHLIIANIKNLVKPFAAPQARRYNKLHKNCVILDKKPRTRRGIDPSTPVGMTLPTVGMTLPTVGMTFYRITVF